MSAFDEDLLACFEDVADDAVYTPKTGDPVATHAQIQARQYQAGAVGCGEFADLWLPRSAVADPGTDDRIAVGDEVWVYRPNPAVQISRKVEGPFWVLRCQRDVCLAIGRRG